MLLTNLLLKVFLFLPKVGFESHLSPRDSEHSGINAFSVLNSDSVHLEKNLLRTKCTQFLRELIQKASIDLVFR